MTITEIHTSDLTRPCMRSVQLRHEGKIDAETTGAMFDGLVFGEACAMAHAAGLADDIDHWGIVSIAWQKCHDRCLAEKQPVSRAVGENAEQTVKDIAALVAEYADRFREHFARWKVIGTEVPIRAAFDVDGEPVDFASHLDLMFRDHTGVLNVWDWKLAYEKDASPEFLARQMQLPLYAVGVEVGEVLIGGEWIAMEERPTVAWIDGASLRTYKRKTTMGDGTVMGLGDRRPLSRIVREVVVRNPTAVLAEFAVRVRMQRAGLWPTNPDPVGCRICASRRWCPSFDRSMSDGN